MAAGKADSDVPAGVIIAKVKYAPASDPAIAISTTTGPGPGLNGNLITPGFAVPPSGAIRVTLEGFLAETGSNNVWWTLLDGSDAQVGYNLLMTTAAVSQRMRVSQLVEGLTAGDSMSLAWAGFSGASTGATLHCDASTGTAAGFGPALMTVEAG